MIVARVFVVQIYPLINKLCNPCHQPVPLSPFPHSSPAQVLSPNQQVRMMVEMLESYDREIQSLEGSINEAEEDLDNTR